MPLLGNAMGFKFSFLVELLEDLERNRYRKASNVSKSVNPDHVIIVQWFNRHDAKIKRSLDEGVAFLSCLFPERRPDRCFHMQETRLASVFGRVYSLGTARLNELRAWKEQTPADFPSYLASILAQTEMPIPQYGNEVTLEEVNTTLDGIAANVKSSAPALRASARFIDPVDALTPILLRLRSLEAKWLVRMLLKSYHPVQVPEAITMQQFHFLLEDLLKIQNDFGAALDTLNQAEISQLPKRVSKADAAVLKARLAGHLVPRVGVMIKRQAYHKARSIRHCSQMAGGKLMSVEQKYDGEYCQVHIDMSKDSFQQIQIFSKSGRDSTQDRVRLHHAIETSLHLQSRSQECKINDRCILEGELLIYSRKTGTIQPFHKIRKHVQHGGRFLNQEADSPIGPDEQVMIMYYDILLLDHIVLLERPQEERRRYLERLIAPVKGLAEIGVQHIVDFQSRTAPEHLRNIFASYITQRIEGLVLKSCKDPYFSCSSGIHGIKLKKDYITELGDIADILLVGARHDPKAKRDLGRGNLKWNSFYMACLENKGDVSRFDAKPRFRVIGVVSYMPEHEMEYLNMRGEIFAIPSSQPNDHMDISMDAKQTKAPAVLFTTPFVVEILGSGYERAPNATYWTLRHPRLHKLHGDRAITDTASFDELQDMARTAQKSPEIGISQEDRDWIAKLKRADPRSKYIVDRSQSIISTTTPGKSTLSLIAASPTSLGTTPRRSLFAIWSDTSTSPEIANRTISQESASPIRIETYSAIKRRCDGEVDILRRKKRRQTEPGNNGGSVLKSLPLARSATFTTIDEARATCTSLVKKTPPWCRPSSSAGPTSSSPFEPPAIFRSSPSKRGRLSSKTDEEARSSEMVREPLKEVMNSSNAYNAGEAQYRYEPHQKDRITLGTDLLQQTTFMLTDARLPPMPIPPSSAEGIRMPKESRDDNVGNEPTDAIHHPPPRPAHLPKEAQTKQTTRSTSTPTPPPPAAPLLLSPSLQSLPTTETHNLQAQIWATNASFTTSTATFLFHIPFHATTITLLDITINPTEIAQEMRDMMDRLIVALGQQYSGNGRQRGRVLFLDWRVLKTMWNGKDGRGVLVDSSWKGLYAGCLKWEYTNESDDGTKDYVHITDCFNWIEAIRLDAE
jgi:DNA ligase-4